MSVLRTCGVAGAVVMIAGAVACKGSVTPAAARASARQVDCSALRAPDAPALVAWDRASRAELDRLRRQGVVAVRYEARGCDVSLELIPHCVGPKNRYVYSPSSGRDTRLARDTNDLYTYWPIGATELSALLEQGRAVRADLKLVGSVGLPEGSTITEYDLVGPECKRATHVVRAIDVGGFALVAGDAQQLGALSDVFDAPPSGAGTEAIAREGHAAICARAEAEKIELSGCAVPLRVELLPLDGTSPPSRCAEGFVFDGSRCVQRASSERSEVECSSAEGDGGCSTVATSDPADSSDAGRPVFDQAAVERVVRQRQASVRRTCWEGATDSLKRISVTVTTKVSAEGNVTFAEASVADSEGPPDVANVVARCIANEVRGWRFPAPDVEQVVSLPFHLLRQ